MSEVTQDAVLETTGARARLARVYAESLLTLAEQENKADDIGVELNTVAFEIIGKHPDIATYVASPIITAKSKFPIMEQAFGSTSELFRKFLRVLGENHRLGLLRDIAVAYQAIRDKQAGRVRVVVRTAKPLDDKQKNELQQTLASKLGKQPILSVRVEPELLGGMIVQVGDRVYDSSVRTRLNNLRNTLLASGSHV